MRSKIMIALLVLILLALNYGIFKKEYIKRHGETLLLEITPVDPRSLMQGDYMGLRYAIARNAFTQSVPALAPQQKRGYMVIRSDENNVAQFVRFHKEEVLAAGEKLLRFHKHSRSVRIIPDSFLFQEGHVKQYEKAKYAIFKFDDSGNHLLAGLASADKQEIKITD